MKNFYLTFPQKSPFRDCYVIIQANDYEEAHEHAIYVFGDKWGNLHEEKKFMNGVKDYYPKGKVGETLVASELHR